MRSDGVHFQSSQCTGPTSGNPLRIPVAWARCTWRVPADGRAVRFGQPCPAKNNIQHKYGLLDYRSINRKNTHLAGGHLEQAEYVAQLLLAGRTRFVDLVSENQYGAGGQRLIDQQRVQLVFALLETTAIPGIDQEDDRVDRWIVILPHTTSCEYVMILNINKHVFLQKVKRFRAYLVRDRPNRTWWNAYCLWTTPRRLEYNWLVLKFNYEIKEIMLYFNYFLFKNLHTIFMYGILNVVKTNSMFVSFSVFVFEQNDCKM